MMATFFQALVRPNSHSGEGTLSLPEYAAGALNENFELACCLIPRIDGAFLNSAHDRDSDVRAIASCAARRGPLMALPKVIA
jgi:hypothetical protein